MTKIIGKKFLPVWIAISAVLIIVGVVLMSIFGFNTSPDYNARKTFEVEYDAVLEVSELTDDLEKLCEDTFRAKGISPVNVKKYDMSNGGYLEYTFRDSVSEAVLLEGKEAVEKVVGVQGSEEIAGSDEKYSAATVTVSVHSVAGDGFNEAIWRGAVGVIVGLIVAWIYLIFRLGLTRASVGFIGAVHDGALTAALLAILRIPVYGYAPLLYAAIGALISLALWTLECAKMREHAKEDAYNALSAEDAVVYSVKSTFKTVILSVLTAAILLLVAGVALMISGVGMQIGIAFLTVLVALAVSTYSSLVLLPAIYAPWKAANDKRKAAKRGGYKGKEKADKGETKSEAALSEVK